MSFVDTDNGGIAVPTDGQAVDEIYHVPIAQNNASNMTEMMVNPNWHSSDIQAILDNPNIVDVRHNGTDW